MVIVEYLLNDTPNIEGNVVSWELNRYLTVLLPCVSLIRTFAFLASMLTGRQVEIKMKYVIQVTNVPEKKFYADYLDCDL